MTHVMPADYIEIACQIVRSTDKAIGVADGTTEMHDVGHGRKVERQVLFWLPRSQVEIDEDNGTVWMPEWLAKKKGLI